MADPLSPSWIEDPGPVLGSIGSMLMAGEQPDFDAKRKAAEDEREAALEAVRSRLSRAEQREFDQTLESCRKANFLWWNEDHNFYIDYRSAIPMRKAALGLGESLDLANPEDMQRRINRGSARVMEELERISNPESTNEDTSDS